MNVLKSFLYFMASLFVAVPLVLLITVPFWKMLWLLLLVVGAVLAFFTYRAGKSFTVKASDNQKLQLEQTYRMLAAKNGGVVPVSALMAATGYDKQTVQERMREVIGRGIAELDFSPNGEVLYKLTPMDEARAQLAAMHEKE